MTALHSARSKYHGKRMSYEDYLALPEEKPYLEYYDGHVAQKPMTRGQHSILQVQLAYQFVQYERSAGGYAGSEWTSHLDIPGNPADRIPDLSYFAPGRDPGSLHGIANPPTLAIEIRSPGQPLRELREKCRMMRANGVDVCWLFDPDARTVEIFEDEADGVVFTGTVLGSPYLPGFELDLTALWRMLHR